MAFADSSCLASGGVIIVVDDNVNRHVVTATGEPTEVSATGSHAVVVSGRDGRDVKINVPGPPFVDPVTALFEAETIQDVYDRSLSEPADRAAGCLGRP